MNSENSHPIYPGEFEKYMNEINGKNKLSVLLNERDGPITSQNKKDLSHTQITEEVN